MAKEKYTAQQIIDALKVTKGMIYLAAERLGCHPETIHNYARRYKSVQSEINDQRGHLVDIAELKLHAMVMEGELGAVKYVLSTLGKGRGYVARSEIDHRIKDVSQLSDDELRAIVETQSGGGT